MEKLMVEAKTGWIVFQSEGTRMGSEPAASGREREQNKEQTLKNRLHGRRNSWSLPSAYNNARHAVNTQLILVK